MILVPLLFCDKMFPSCICVKDVRMAVVAKRNLRIPSQSSLVAHILFSRTAPGTWQFTGRHELEQIPTSCKRIKMPSYRIILLFLTIDGSEILHQLDR